MAALAGVLATLLSAVAALHALWGMRIWWPLGDEQKLARAVVGARNIEKMPSRISCFLVALALAFIALVTLQLGKVAAPIPLPDWALALAGLCSAGVFIVRGVAGFLPFWARLAPEEPFRSYDRKYYAPLCLILGTGLLVLMADRIMA